MIPAPPAACACASGAKNSKTMRARQTAEKRFMVIATALGWNSPEVGALFLRIRLFVTPLLFQALFEHPGGLFLSSPAASCSRSLTGRNKVAISLSGIVDRQRSRTLESSCCRRGSLLGRGIHNRLPIGLRSRISGLASEPIIFGDPRQRQES
jgi:hypothetical protein